MDLERKRVSNIIRRTWLLNKGSCSSSVGAADNNNNNKVTTTITTTTTKEEERSRRSIILLRTRGIGDYYDPYYCRENMNIREDIDDDDDDDTIVSSWYLYTLPLDCLLNNNNNNNNNNDNNNNNNNRKKKKKKITKTDLLFNHSLRHVFPIPLQVSPHVDVSSQFSGLHDASWVVLGSTVYFFGVDGYKIYSLERDVDGSISSTNFKFVGVMNHNRRAPKLATLDGKIYVFGNNKVVWGEVFEPRPLHFQGVSNDIDSPIPAYFQGVSNVIDSPIPASSASNVLFVGAIEKQSKIVVGFDYKFIDRRLVKLLYPDVEATEGTSVFVYDVAAGSWVKHKNDLFVNRKSRLLCAPIVVDCCLYWLDSNMMWAYDLDTDQYFEGPIEDELFRKFVDTDTSSYREILLLHSGDVFYMIWGGDCGLDLHCTTIQVLKTTTNLHGNHFKLRATMSCCQTFHSTVPHSTLSLIRNGALIL